MDVEGTESAVLAGAIRILESRHATWLVALLHGDEQRQSCVAKLEAAGYRLVTLNGQAWRDAPAEEDELLAVPVQVIVNASIMTVREYSTRKSILVTGYIGSHCAVALLEARRELVIADNLSNSRLEILDRIERIVGKARLRAH